MWQAGIGAILDIAGNAMLAKQAGKDRKRAEGFLNDWLPDIDEYTSNYFRDLGKYAPQASDLSRTLGKEEMTNQLALREMALPGIGAGLMGQVDSASALARGELPDDWLASIMRGGAAAGVGSGMGGSQASAFMTGLGGVRGKVGAMQLGSGLLTALLGTMPHLQSADPMKFLSAIMTPAQQTEAQLNLRQQQLAQGNTFLNMDTSGEVWAKGMKAAGGMLMGGGMGGIGGAGGGGMGGGGSGGWAVTGSTFPGK